MSILQLHADIKISFFPKGMAIFLCILVLTLCYIVFSFPFLNILIDSQATKEHNKKFNVGTSLY